MFGADLRPALCKTIVKIFFLRIYTRLILSKLFSSLGTLPPTQNCFVNVGPFMFSLNSINDNSFKEDIQALSFIWDRSHVVNERKQTKHPYRI